MEDEVNRDESSPNRDVRQRAAKRIVLWRKPTGNISGQEENTAMTTFNAIFAQLTGGGTAPPSPGQTERDRGMSSGGGVGGVGGGGDGGSSGRRSSGSGSTGGSTRERGVGSGSASDMFGVPLMGSVVAYDPKNDKRDFGTPQVRMLWLSCKSSYPYSCGGRGGEETEMLCCVTSSNYPTTLHGAHPELSS